MDKVRISIWSWVTGVGIFGLLLWFTITHFGEEQQFIVLASHIHPIWLFLALTLQAGTYICVGTIWYQVASSAGYHPGIRALARLSIEKVSINQLVPTGGISGNMVVVRAMKRLGLPTPLAMEALIVDIFSFYSSYATVAGITFVILWSHGDTTPAITSLVLVFTILVLVGLISFWWVLFHRNWKPSSWLSRFAFVKTAIEALRQVSPKRIRKPLLIFQASILHISIFLFDTGTLWVMMRAIGNPIHFSAAFTTLVIASIAGNLSLLPGGLGTFEASSTAMLVLLGTPLEAALTGTLLLRGLTLWLPLIPGIFLARRDSILTS